MCSTTFISRTCPTLFIIPRALCISLQRVPYVFHFSMYPSIFTACVPRFLQHVSHDFYSMCPTIFTARVLCNSVQCALLRFLRFLRALRFFYVLYDFHFGACLRKFITAYSLRFFTACPYVIHYSMYLRLLFRHVPYVIHYSMCCTNFIAASDLRNSS
jgi:hypothetical protein